MAARANDISDLVILRTDRRTNGVGITKADAFSGTARNRLSIDLRIAASVAREVNIFTVRRECGLCIDAAACGELSEVLTVGIQQLNLRAAVLRQCHCQRTSVRAESRRTVVAPKSSDLAALTRAQIMNPNGRFACLE